MTRVREAFAPVSVLRFSPFGGLRWTNVNDNINKYLVTIFFYSGIIYFTHRLPHGAIFMAAGSRDDAHMALCPNYYAGC